ncbi:hypothetical protein DY000_02015106 [Brassica cretica]|uniref:DUF4005 domain-containing protein n=1 Tax=Brassica cretica TaxID=69181 RepID=A0ABQ7D477_BRACR|nr:hypothetical protein DY000_02015106 [Brassica cretica]
MELRSVTAKLEATVKTEHGAGPEHGRRLGRLFTVARRFDCDSCDGEKRRLWSFWKWIHGVVRAWLIPVTARTKKNKTNRACRGEASRDEASRSQATTNPFSRPQGPFAEESWSRPCVKRVAAGERVSRALIASDEWSRPPVAAKLRRIHSFGRRDPSQRRAGRVQVSTKQPGSFAGPRRVAGRDGSQPCVVKNDQEVSRPLIAG